MQRRTFIKKTCVACIGMTSLGIFLDSCATSQTILRPSIENNAFSIALEKFELSNNYIIRNKNLAFDILVLKNKNQYSALQMRCTHEAMPLNFSGNKIVCSTHGSEFDLHGAVTKEPASVPLTKYKTSISGQQLIIYLK